MVSCRVGSVGLVASRPRFLQCLDQLLNLCFHRPQRVVGVVVQSCYHGVAQDLVLEACQADAVECAQQMVSRGKGGLMGSRKALVVSVLGTRDRYYTRHVPVQHLLLS